MHLIDRYVGGGRPLFLIAGPCVIESLDLCRHVAEYLANLREQTGILIIFKASFDKANRTSGTSFRGPGIDEGLRILDRIGDEFNLPVITDVHLPEQAADVAEVCAMLQIPAFLCRQTDLVLACAATGRPLNIKKGQWMAPEDMKSVADKIGHDHSITLCERGTSFGYHNLVVDFRGLEIMRGIAPVVFDATHSCQRPGSEGTHSGGDRHMVQALARCAVAMGVDGLFFETHPDPDHALSDGPNMVPLDEMNALIKNLLQIDQMVKSYGDEKF